MIKPHPVFLPNAGVVLTGVDQFLKSTYSPDSKNMQYNNQRIQGRPGFTEFDPTVLSGPVLLVDQFWKTNATYELMVCTTKDIYKYDFDNERYDILTKIYNTGTIEIAAGTLDTVTGSGTSWDANLKAGDYIKIGAGELHTESTWYEIESVDSDTQLTLTGNAVETAPGSAYVARKIFTGAETNLWTRTEFLDDTLGEIWIASNGVDKPVYYTGSNQVVDLTMPTDVTAAKFIITYYDRLVICWTREGGENQPTRLRWSSVADANTWNDLHVIDLVQPDFTWWIQGMCLFGDYLVITKEAGAYVARPVATDDIFDFEFASHFFGNFAPHSLIPIGNKIYYFGYENRFRVASLTSDEPFFDAVAPYTRVIDPTLAEHTYGYQMEYIDEIRWFLPFDSGNNIQPVVVYNYLHNVTQIWEYVTTSGFACVGEYLNQEDLYVDDDVWGEYYVDEQIGYWDDRKLLANAPVVLYGGRDGVVYIADQGITDNGSTYARKFATSRIDHGMPQVKKRMFRQQWWFDAEPSGTVTIKLKKDDDVSYDPSTKSISLVDDNKDVIKKLITWDKQYTSGQYEVTANNHFALIGFMNWISEKGKENA